MIHIRFVPLHSAEASPETWTLKIQRPELADAGEYECQVFSKAKYKIIRCQVNHVFLHPSTLFRLSSLSFVLLLILIFLI